MAVKFGGCGRRRVNAAKAIMPIIVVILKFTASSSSNVGDKVVENKPVPVDNLAKFHVYRSSKVRSMPHEL